jgi:hypothetical protein
MSLFSKAKKVAPKKKSAKVEKTRITVEGDEFFKKVETLEGLNDKMKSAKAKADMISSEIKEIGREEWAKLYGETKKNPGSVMLENKDGEDIAQVMFVPTDRYITLNEEKAEELIETFGEDVVTEVTEFSFDAKMIEKYGEILSNLIEECDDIKESDKEKIVKAVTKYSVSKGSIDKFLDYNEDVELVMEVLKPVVALKNVEVIKG